MAGTASVTATLAGDQRVSTSIGGTATVSASVARIRSISATAYGTTTIGATLAPPAPTPGFFPSFKRDLPRRHRLRPPREVALGQATVHATATVAARLAIIRGAPGGVLQRHPLPFDHYDEEEEIAALYALGVL